MHAIWQAVLFLNVPRLSKFEKNGNREGERSVRHVTCRDHVSDGGATDGSTVRNQLPGRG